MIGRRVKQPMYKLNYTPIRLKDFNDYFVRYKGTKDITFINEFLHFYEPVLERKYINSASTAESRKTEKRI